MKELLTCCGTAQSIVRIRLGVRQIVAVVYVPSAWGCGSG